MKTQETSSTTETFTPSKRWLNVYLPLPNGKKLYLSRGIGFDNLPAPERSGDQKLHDALTNAFETKEAEGIARFLMENLRVEAFSQNVKTDSDFDDNIDLGCL